MHATPIPARSYPPQTWPDQAGRVADRAEPNRMVRLDACLTARFKKRLQTFVPDRLYHTVKLYSVALRMSAGYSRRRSFSACRAVSRAQ